jgi:hypothetical protein
MFSTGKFLIVNAHILEGLEAIFHAKWKGVCLNRSLISSFERQPPGRVPYITARARIKSPENSSHASRRAYRVGACRFYGVVCDGTGRVGRRDYMRDKNVRDFSFVVPAIPSAERTQERPDIHPVPRFIDSRECCLWADLLLQQAH